MTRTTSSGATLSEAYDRPTLREEADRDHRRIDRRLDRDHVGQGDEDSHLQESAAARRRAGGGADADAGDGAGRRRLARISPPQGMPVDRRGGGRRRRRAAESRRRSTSSRRWSARSTSRRSRARSRTSSVGDRVSKGQILCIIEAMKIMNEIESEYSGVVREILVAGRAAGRIRAGALQDRSQWLIPRRRAAPTGAASDGRRRRAGINFKAVLQEMIRRNGSDLHLKVGRPPTLRVDGELDRARSRAAASRGSEERSPSSS